MGYHLKSKAPSQLNKAEQVRIQTLGQQLSLFSLCSDSRFLGGSQSLLSISFSSASQTAQRIPRLFSLSCRVVCSRGCSWFSLWTSSKLPVESKRGPGFNRWPQCVHCVLVKVHLLQLPVQCRKKNTHRMTEFEKHDQFKTQNRAEFVRRQMKLNIHLIADKYLLFICKMQ